MNLDRWVVNPMLLERLLYLINLTGSSAGTSQRSLTGMCHSSSATTSCRPMVNGTHTGSVAPRARWNQHNRIHSIISSTETSLQQTPTKLRNSSSATPSCYPMAKSTNTGSVATRVRWNQHNLNTTGVPAPKPDDLCRHDADHNPTRWYQRKIKEMEKERGLPSAKGCRILK